MRPYQDPTLTPEERARDLLSRMSMEEKLAQTTCIFDKPGELEALEPRFPLGIGQVSALEWRMLPSLQAVAHWQRTLQQRIMEHSPHRIPAIFHMEGLCGAYVQDATSFPAGISRGSTFDPELEEQVGRIVGRQERAVGVTNTLAPVLDIARDPRMGRQGETYGEDPTLTAALGAAFTRGIQSEDGRGRRSQSVAKHFLGFHASEGGSHGAPAEINPRTLREVFGKPFQAAISEADLQGIMPCYCCINGEPVSASSELLQGLLREEMGFDGLVVSDYGAVGGVYAGHRMENSLAEGGLRCMKAGMDVELPNAEAYNEDLLELFRSGKGDPALLDQAAYRVLRAKFRMGLFEHPYALEGADLEQAFYDPQDAAVSLQSARESLVLLKNDGTLPLSPAVKKIALIGCHGDNARSFFGGYTHLSMVEAVHAVANSMAGVGTDSSTQGKEMLRVPGTQVQSDETEEFDAILRQQKPGCKSLLAQLREALPEAEIRYAYGYPVAGADESHFAEALELVKESDLVLLTLGGKHGSCSVATMGEGVDAADIGLPPCQDRFLRLAAAYGKPMVGIHFNGRPISSDAAEETLSAILEAWNPSEFGAQAITEVLTGAIDPSGRLPITAARSSAQLPLYYNHQWGAMWHHGAGIGFAGYVDMTPFPRYHFGEGLSYTTFAIGAPELDRSQVGPFDPITARVPVTNTGSRTGTAVVQLYGRDEYANMARPMLELVGFGRMELQPGETGIMTFVLLPSQFAFLDQDMRWRIEKGDITLLAGSSSVDLPGERSFAITETAWIQGKDRGFYSIGAVETSGV